ncbi:MAG: hypothetical protein ACYCPR_10275 [Thermoplasmataceae archaeon]
MTRLLELSERSIAYLTEQAILIALTALIDIMMGIKSVFLDFFVLYKSNFPRALTTIFETKVGWIDLTVLTLISFLYYLTETSLKVGIGVTIFRKSIISRYERDNKEFNKLMLLRIAVKSFFILELANFLFIIKYRKYLQTLFDHLTGLYVVRGLSKIGRSKSLEYLLSSVLIYYVTFILFLLIFTTIAPATPIPQGSGSPGKGPGFYIFFNQVLQNNLTIDLFDYVSGGFSIFIGAFVQLLSTNILETIAMSGFINGSTFQTSLRYMLPQLFPETLGYVFGLATAMILSDIMLSFFQSMLRREKNELFIEKVKELGKIGGFFLLTSISLIILGALVEASLGF